MRSGKHQAMRIEKQRWLSDLLIIGGVLLLAGVAMALAKQALATSQLSEYRFLTSSVEPRLYIALPPARAQRVPEEQAPVQSQLDSESELESTPPKLFLPLVQNSELEVPEISQEVPKEAPVDEPVETPELPPIGVRVGPSAGPVVRLVIPALKVDRPVVMVGLKRGSNRQLEWNTDSLFSTSNRPDLVGQIEVSANPGDGGNIILMGHNYNNGWYANAGVFVNLQNLKQGSQVILYTEDGSQFTYIVQQVKKVPWQKQNAAELEKHQKFLWPTAKEQVTLVTCGGTNLLSWSARIYVVATPAGETASN